LQLLHALEVENDVPGFRCTVLVLQRISHTADTGLELLSRRLEWSRTYSEETVHVLVLPSTLLPMLALNC
jgi:hypothetical protein